VFKCRHRGAAAMLCYVTADRKCWPMTDGLIAWL